MMKAILISLLILIGIHSSGQTEWTNLLQEDQAALALSKNDHINAIKLYKEALEIRKLKYPQGTPCNINVFKEISEAMGNLIRAYGKAGQYEKQIKLSRDQSKWSEIWIDLFSDSHTPYLEYGISQIQMAESYEALKDYDQGLIICNNLIDYFLNARDSPGFQYVARQMIPLAHGRAGQILYEKGDLRASVKEHEKSLASWQSAATYLDSSLTDRKIALQAEICYYRYGELKDSTNVIKYCEIASKYYHKLMEMDSGNENLIESAKIAENTEANYKVGRAEYHEAIGHYKKSLSLNESQFEQKGNIKYLQQMTALNLLISECFKKLNDIPESITHLTKRTEQLIKLQKISPSADFPYSISKDQYNLAKMFEMEKRYANALEILDQSILWAIEDIKNDPTNVDKKKWQGTQQYFHLELLIQMADYDLARTSLDRLYTIFTEVAELETEVDYSENMKEIEIIRSQLMYPEVMELEKEIISLEDGPMKYDRYLVLVHLLEEKLINDERMQNAYIKHVNGLAWTGFIAGEFEESIKPLQKAMKMKPVDPYLITNYAPCLLFLGEYKKAENFYLKYYDRPFKPGKKIIDGFLHDFDFFESKGIIPVVHRKKAGEIKAKLHSLTSN